MVIDTSALAAILFDEPDAEEYEAAIDAESTRLLSCASWLETSIVVEARFGERGAREFDLLLRRVPFEIAAITQEQVEIARIAFRRYGWGRHKARLKFGDCFAYALAKVSSEPLLYTGNAFVLTEVKSALRRRSH
jgi:ribonuclease VapC